MKWKLFLTLFFCLFLYEISVAQLVSWRDIIEADHPEPTERIYFGSDSLQFGDLWLPEDEPAHTTVILIHGGCWLDLYPGVELMHLMADDLRKQGFAVWNLEYRRLGYEGGGYPGTFRDIANGADHLRQVDDDYNLNLDRIIASGHSAGGHLATWLAARENISTESDLYTENPIEIQGVISLAGINDLERYAAYGSSSCGDQTVERLVNQLNRGDFAYNDTSPSRLLPISAPIVEITAAFDAPVPPFFGYNFVNDAQESGTDAKQILLTESGHFEMISPWTDEWQEVLSVFLQILD